MTYISNNNYYKSIQIFGTYLVFYIIVNRPQMIYNYHLKHLQPKDFVCQNLVTLNSLFFNRTMSWWYSEDNLYNIGKRADIGILTKNKNELEILFEYQSNYNHSCDRSIRLLKLPNYSRLNFIIREDIHANSSHIIIAPQILCNNTLRKKILSMFQSLYCKELSEYKIITIVNNTSINCEDEDIRVQIHKMCYMAHSLMSHQQLYYLGVKLRIPKNNGINN